MMSINFGNKNNNMRRGYKSGSTIQPNIKTIFPTSKSLVESMEQLKFLAKANQVKKKSVFMGTKERLSRLSKSKQLMMRASNASPFTNTPTHHAFAVTDILSRDKLRKFRALKRKQRNSVMVGKNRRNTNYDMEEFVDQIEIKNLNAETSCLVIHPDSMYKIIWDVIGMLFIIFQCVMVPLRLCFDVGSFGVFDIIQDFYFIADILLSLNTGFYTNGLITMTRKEILLTYLKCGFWLDTAASFPYSMVLSFEAYFNFEVVDNTHTIKATQLLRLLKFMRMLRILRLLRVLKLQKILQQLEDYIMSDVFNLFIEIFKLLFLILFIAHLGACFWFLIGTTEFETTGVGWVLSAQIIDADVYTQYVFSLYYYITTMTTIGYGDIVPKTSNEKLYAMSNMLLANGVFAYVIGSLGNFISAQYDAETNFKQKMVDLSQFLIHRNINKSLRMKIRKYLEHVLEHKKEHKIDESEVLQLLNKNLRDEINLHLKGHLLKSIPFLHLNEEFCILLTYIMKEETVNPNEVIFEKGQESNRIYFLTKGKVCINDQVTKIVYKELAEDRYFGEIGFFSKKPRIASAETINFCNLTYMIIDEFDGYAYRFKFTNRSKFKVLKEQIETIYKDIRNSNYTSIKSACYFCRATNHLAPRCPILKEIDEMYKLKFKDNRHRTDTELEFVFKILNASKSDKSMSVIGEEESDSVTSIVKEEKFFPDFMFNDVEDEREREMEREKEKKKENEKEKEKENEKEPETEKSLL